MKKIIGLLACFAFIFCLSAAALAFAPADSNGTVMIIRHWDINGGKNGNGSWWAYTDQSPNSLHPESWGYDGEEDYPTLKPNEKWEDGSARAGGSDPIP